MKIKRVHRAGVGLAAVVAATAGATAGATAVPVTAASGPDGTQARAWQPRQLVASGAPTPNHIYGKYSQVVTGPDGRQTAVWIRSRDFTQRLLMAHREPGSAWSEPTVVDGTSVSVALGDVAVDGRGRVTVLWDRYRRDDGHASLARTWQPGDGFGTTTVLGRGEYAEDIAAGHLATNDRGDVTATYGEPVHAAFKPADGDWQPSQQLGRTGDTSTAIAMDGEGNTFAVSDRKHSRIVLRTFRPDTNGWSDAETITTIPYGWVDPAVASNEDGDLVIAWTLARLDVEYDYFSKADAVYRPAGSDFGPIHRLYRRTSEGFVDGYAPTVGIDRRGIAHVAWIRPDGSNPYGLFAARRMATGGWTQPRLLARHVDEGTVTLSVNPRGDVLVTGTHSTDRQRLFAVDRPAGTGYADAQRLTRHRVRDGASSDLAPDGSATVLYRPVGERQLYTRASPTSAERDVFPARRALRR